MRVLLDTHTLIWWASDELRLTKKSRDVITNLQNEVLVSAASAWEIATKVRLGKLPGAETFAYEFSARVRLFGFRELPITIEHGRRAGMLPGNHKDPFDRILVAQALTEGVPIVSNEQIFDDWHVPRIW